ncbi:gsr1351 [Gloeobacter violaceus PCC 7421]|uniref:Gsr1351 protein n=1 Tax=Gloeobacter violaceus (strain ATCC 29082 / PCC 7421) TaxID=251221 RepID=Q7NKX5_GLOVI|nr:DUF4351 domain-containing protein [Gloeobacter violaceus]BAC89292.1 gsr1351 [Gloeobacter violaceus PCC 7421]
MAAALRCCIHRVEFPGFTVLEFHYRVLQLNRLNWRDYMRQENPVASALMAKMRIAPGERPIEQVRTLSVAELEALSEALLDFHELADLITWLAQK